MTYKLINNKTKEEHFCDKVTIDGFDYYVSDELPKENDFATDGLGIFPFHSENPCQAIICNPKKVIATNNPNIEVPQLVDEVERLSQEYTNKRNYLAEEAKGFYDGYNKSQETHPFSEEDMFDFHEWLNVNDIKQESYSNNNYYFNRDILTKEQLLQLWKEQQPKIVYYE